MHVIPASELIINPDGTIYHLNIKPEDIADTIITVGDPDRVAKVSQFFDSIELKVAKREFVTHTGHYKGKRLSVISTGMGTDNIEIFMNEIDALANIDLTTRTIKPAHKTLNIIRIGTSGGLQTDIKLDIELASATAVGLDTLMCFYALPQSDNEMAITTKMQSAFQLSFRPYMATASEELMKKVAFDMVPGNTLTCPGFYAPQGRELRLKTIMPDLVKAYQQFAHNDFRITNFEMETAGYYSLGRLLGHNMLSLNAIVAQRIANEFSTKSEQTIESIIHKVLDRV